VHRISRYYKKVPFTQPALLHMRASICVLLYICCFALVRSQQLAFLLHHCFCRRLLIVCVLLFMKHPMPCSFLLIVPIFDSCYVFVVMRPSSTIPPHHCCLSLQSCTTPLAPNSSFRPGRQACPHLEVRVFHRLCHGCVKCASCISLCEIVN
jgi:hypothetical protein